MCVAGLALACTATLAACSHSDNSRQSNVSGIVKIGVLAPSTGGDQGSGRDTQRGAELARSFINAGKEWPGYQPGQIWGPSGHARLSVVTLDTKNDQQHAADEAATLAADRDVAGIVGALDSDATLDASQRAERLQTPFINGDAPLTALTERGLDWFFRAGPDAADYGGAVLSLFRNIEQQRQVAQRVAVLYSNDATGDDLRSTVAEFVEDAGNPIVASAPYEPEGTELPAAVATIRAAAPDVVLTTASSGTGEKIGDAFRAGGYIPPEVVVYGAPVEASRLTEVPGFEVRVSRQAPWSPTIARANPLAAVATERYQQDFGTPMTTNAAMAFTTATILARAIMDADSIDRERVRSALVALDLPGNATIMP
ncbi:ABC transporter substrate-binding protein [Frankia sp. AgB32]|nr:ABC transporter substrate-binding protein [Frankia sp. AgB32]